jgi:hypothetical protein
MLVLSSFELVVKSMFPFDLSFIDIALLIAITALIVLYVTLLLRLKPSTKPTLEAHLDEETHIEGETHIEEERGPEKPRTTIGDQTRRLEIPEEPRKPVEASETREKLFVPVGNREVPEEPEVQIETGEVPEIPKMPEEPVESFEFPKAEEETLAAKPPKVSPKSSSECPHYFGYLKKLPKNVPIPDECLGCVRIMECLHSSPVPE